MYPNDPHDPRRRDARGEYRDDNRTRAYSSDPYARDQYAQDPYAQDPYAQDAYRDAGYGQQYAATPEPARKRSTQRRGPQINIGLFIGGVVATAVVTALASWLVAWIIRVISQRITETGKFGVWNPVAQDEYWFAVVGGLCALFAGALWYVLQMTTPSPDQFYAWIVGLLVIAAVILPLLLSREISTGIGTAVMHLVIGLPILFLIRAMGSRSVEYR